MTSMRVDQIIIGERRREDLGDIAGLAASILKYGQLQPIVVDAQCRLVAGERRLRAMQKLGQKWIEVTQLDELPEAKLREMELEENERRKALTDAERSREMVRKAREMAPLLSSKLEDKPSRPGRRTYAAPKADVAQALGVGVAEVVRAEQHVATMDAHPVFQKPDWKQYHVLEAKTHLESIPADVVPAVMAIIDQPATPPKEALKVMASVAAMPAADRQRFVTLATSDDSRDRTRALTDAAAMTPMPDPRLKSLRDAMRGLSVCVREYPDDPLTPRIDAAMTEIRNIVQAIKEAA